MVKVRSTEGWIRNAQYGDGVSTFQPSSFVSSQHNLLSWTCKDLKYIARCLRFFYDRLNNQMSSYRSMSILKQTPILCKVD